MAAPITHTILALQALDSQFNGLDSGKFLIGTNFPDIRYLWVIGREVTHGHGKFTTVESIPRENAFIAWMAFHAYIDHIRCGYVDTRKIHLKYSQPYAIAALKFVEDRYFYNQIEDWGMIIHYFDTLPTKELTFNIPKDVITQWFHIIKEYLRAFPSNESIEDFLRKLNFSDQTAREIISIINTMEHDSFIADYLNNFDTLSQAGFAPAREWQHFEFSQTKD